MNSILILTLPLVFFPGLGPSLTTGSFDLNSDSLSLSESRPASPLDLFMAGDSTTKGPCVPLRAAGLSSTNWIVFILAAVEPSGYSESRGPTDSSEFVLSVCLTGALGYSVVCCPPYQLRAGRAGLLKPNSGGAPYAEIL